MANIYPHSYNTETAEYKSKVPSIAALVRDIAAFANTKGGQIFIGYMPIVESSPIHTGLTEEEVREAIDQIKDALHLLSPEPLVEITTHTTSENKQFVVADVQKHPVPVLISSTYLKNGIMFVGKIKRQ